MTCLEIAVLSGPTFPVRGIDPGGPDGDPHLAGAGMRLVDLDDLQDLRAAIFAELNRFHEPLLSPSLDGISSYRIHYVLSTQL